MPDLFGVGGLTQDLMHTQQAFYQLTHTLALVLLSTCAEDGTWNLEYFRQLDPPDPS